MHSKVSALLAVLILSLSVVATGTQVRDPNFTSFKRDMMPKVGKKITVVGTLSSGKLGYWIAFKRWGVYIYAKNRSDLPKTNALSRLIGRTVEVSGTLRYYAGVASARPDRATAPEHFFFDVGEAQVIPLSSPEPKQSQPSGVSKMSERSTTPDNSFKSKQ